MIAFVTQLCVSNISRVSKYKADFKGLIAVQLFLIIIFPESPHADLFGQVIQSPIKLTQVIRKNFHLSFVTLW